MHSAITLNLVLFVCLLLLIVLVEGKLLLFKIQFLYPPTEWGGIIVVFGVDSVHVDVRFRITSFPNQQMDFDQSCIDILLGGFEKLIRFDDLDLVFKVTIL